MMPSSSNKLNSSPVACQTWQIVPFNIQLIRCNLSPIAYHETRKILLSPSFLIPFLIYRDTLLLTPGTKPCNLSAAEAAIDELAKIIYTKMDVPYVCTYDRPPSDAMAKFSPDQHFECLIYQACRNLARPEMPFGDFFKRERLGNKPGRMNATNKIKALIVTAHNLVLAYTVLPPGDVVREIERRNPSKNPKLSPIPEVRRKATLSSKDIDTRRQQVIDTERNGQDEREWLVNKLMQKEALAPSRIEVVKVDEDDNNGKRKGGASADGESDRAKKRMHTG